MAAPGLDTERLGDDMKRCWRLSFSLFLLAIIPVASYAQGLLSSGVISLSRAINWSDAGVAGGIPTNRSQCGSTIAAYGSNGSPASPAAINNTIAGCRPGTYVLLGAGTFYLNAGIKEQAPTNGVTIRGMGADQTFLVFSGLDNCQGLWSDVCLESSDTNYRDSVSNQTTWTASRYAAGQTTLTFAAVPNLKVGNPVLLDQEDDACASGCPSATDTGTVFVCSDNSISVPCSGQGNGASQRNLRNMTQIVTVVSCNGNATPGAACSGTNVTVVISPVLYMPTWAANHAPGAWWATGPILNAGVEDMSIDNSNTNGKTVGIFNCLNCWVKGTRLVDSNFASVYINLSARVSVVNNYLFLSQTASSTSYGIAHYVDSDSLDQNNIMNAIATPTIINGGEGDVIAYNFSALGYYTTIGYNLAASNAHTAGTDLDLWEGNHFDAGIVIDDIHGTHNFATMFRNYLKGTQVACFAGPNGASYANSTFGACTNGQSAVHLQSYARFSNIVGNVLGQTGVITNYQNASNANVYSIGVYDAGGGASVPYDPLTLSTLMRWGNCDSVNGFSAANCQWNLIDVPTGLTGNQAAFAIPLPLGHTLPASLYNSSQPPWWPSGKAWPPIGPDVTGGNEPGVGGLAYTIPAEDCYTSMGGAANGYNVRPLTFNENVCYGTSTTTQQPQPPTNLSATVQ